MDEKMDEERMGLMGDWMCGQLMVDDVLKEGWMEGVSFKSRTKGKLQLEIEIRFFVSTKKNKQRNNDKLIAGNNENADLFEV